MADSSKETVIMSGLAGVAFVRDQEQPKIGALAPRNFGVVQLGSDSGVFLRKTPIGTVIEAETANHRYRLVHVDKGSAEISGHPIYCPEPVLVELRGARWLDKTLDDCYLAPGLKLQFVDRTGRSVLTSHIRSIRVLKEP
jgi:hypothetical protein